MMSWSSSSPALSEQLSAVGHEDRAHFHNLIYLAIRYASHGCHEVAMALCKQALEKLEMIADDDNPDVTTMLNTLSIVYHFQSKYKEAIDLLHDALAVGEKALGETHPAVVVTLNNLSVIYGRRGNYQAAEPLCRRALEIREKIRGRDHPDVAKQLNNLALLCQSQNKYEEAIEKFQRALEIYQTKLGPGNLNVVKTENFLASCCSKRKIYEDTNTNVNELSEQGPIEQDLLTTHPDMTVGECKEELDAVNDLRDLQTSANSLNNEETHREEKVNSSTSNENVSMLTIHKGQSTNHVPGPSGIKKKIFRIFGIRKNCTPA